MYRKTRIKCLTCTCLCLCSPLPPTNHIHSVYTLVRVWYSMVIAVHNVPSGVHCFFSSCPTSGFALLLPCTSTTVAITLRWANHARQQRTGRKPKLVSCWFPAPCVCGWLLDYNIVHHKIVAFFRVTSSWWPEFSVLIVRMVMWDCLLSTSSSFSSPPPQVIVGMDFLRWHYPHIPGITFIGQMVMLTTLLGFCLEGICTTALVPLAIWYCVVPTGHPHQWVNWRIKLRKVAAKLALLW